MEGQISFIGQIALPKLLILLICLSCKDLKAGVGSNSGFSFYSFTFYSVVDEGAKTTFELKTGF
jgi:hypothetical protein